MIEGGWTGIKEMRVCGVVERKGVARAIHERDFPNRLISDLKGAGGRARSEDRPGCAVLAVWQCP